MMLTYTDPTGTQHILDIDHNELFFGAVLVGNVSEQKTLTLTNRGWGDISLRELSIAGDGFSMLNDASGVILKPGKNVSFAVTFAPSTKSTASGSIFIDAGIAGTANIRLYGAGYSGVDGDVDITGMRITPLFSDLETDELLNLENGTKTWVYNDPDFGLNGFYTKNGASGSGSFNGPEYAFSSIMANGTIDLDNIEDVANGGANLNGTGLVPMRLGGNRKTIAKLESEYQQIINAQVVQEQAASDAATVATTQAGIATTQAGIATTQAGLAATNGAAQTSLATAQANIATDMASVNGLSYSQVSAGRSPRIAPSASWNGTLGTGWSSGEPTASPVRALTDPAQPEIAPFYPYHRCAFNTRTRLLFNVEERDPTKPVNMRVHLEGNTVDVPADTFQRYVGDDGIERAAWLRAFDLDWANFSVNGKCRFWVEAIPSDTTMVSRIIGPFEMKRKTGNLWDATLTFGPGGTYADFAAARAAAVAAPYNTSSYEHIWLKPLASHNYDVVGRTVPVIYNRWGKTLIDGNPGVIWRVHSSEWRTTSQNFEVGLDGAIWGPSCAFDMRRMSSFIVPRSTQGATQNQHFAGVRFYNDNGRNDMFGNGVVLAANSGSTALSNPDARDRRNPGFVSNPASAGMFADFTECTFEGACRPPTAGLAQLARNCIIRGGSEDIFSPSNTDKMQWGLCYNNVAIDCSPIDLRTTINAISIIYGGAAATATVTFIGSNNAAGTRIELRENGSLVYSVSVSTTLGTGNYSVAEVVAWINANCAGWTATTLDNTRRASYFSAKTAANAKGVAVVNSTWIDNHADGWQIGLISGQNYVAKGNQFYRCGALQIFFLSIQSSTKIWTDCAWYNNIVYFDPTDAEVIQGAVLSQWEGRFSNVRVDHNYNPGQAYYVRTQSGTTSFDDKCSINGNITDFMTLEAGTSLGTCDVKYNQAVKAGAGAFPAGTNVANNLVSTTIAADPVPTKIKYDVLNNQRAVITRRGPFQ